MTERIPIDSLLGYAVAKIPQIDPEYYLELLGYFSEGEWFFPTNGDNENWSVCDQLARQHVIQRKTVPHWRDGKFYGESHAFLYRRDMEYKGGSEPF